LDESSALEEGMVPCTKCEVWTTVQPSKEERFRVPRTVGGCRLAAGWYGETSARSTDQAAGQTRKAKHSRKLVETILRSEQAELRSRPARCMQEVDSRNVRRGCAVDIGPGGISEVELQPAAEKWIPVWK